MPRTASEPPKGRLKLTLAQLASYDDILTDALVDRAFFWTKIRKNRNKYFASRGIREESVTSILLHDVIVAKDTKKAEKALLNLPGLKKYVEKLGTDLEKEWFKRHLRKYIDIYLPDCPFEVTTTNRYTITTHEAAVSARKYISAGKTIKYLTGTLVPLTREEERDLDLTRRDFSIVMSSRKKMPLIFLGPARFANHDCDANARLVMRGSEGMEVVAKRDIEIGEEITVTYGDNYFGIDNCECLCYTCEKAVRNGWAPPSATENHKIIAASPEATEIDYQTVGSVESTDAGHGFATSNLNCWKRRKLEGGTASPRLEISPASNPDPITMPYPDLRHRRASEGMHLHAPEPDRDRKSTSTTDDLLSCAATDESSLDPLVSTPATSVSDVPRGLNSVPTDPAVDISECKETQEKTLQNNRKLPEFVLSDGEDELSDLSTSYELDDAKMTIVKRGTTTLKSRKKRERRIWTTVEPEPPKHRIPGDYTRTPKLLAQRYDRWVDCHTCSAWFVQSDSYLTRKECPRCERHSKLYGYQWPKTDKEGPHDTEERVMDHRTIHRFLPSSEETRIQRRGRGLSQPVSQTPEVLDVKIETPDATESGETRRITRARRRAAKELLIPE